MNVKPFQPLLAAQTPKDVDKFLGSLEFPLLGSPKYDGVRAVVRGLTLMTRKLKPVKNELLQRFLGVDLLEGVDGELIMGGTTDKKVFQRTQSAQSKASAGFDEMSITYHLFDLHDHPDWKYYERARDLLQRYGKRYKLSQMGPGIFVLPVKQVLLNNVEEVLKMEELVLANGFEGLMLRSPDGLYKQGRSTVNEQILLKLKRFEFDAAEVLSAYEQRENLNEKTTDERGYSKRSSHQANKVGKGTLGGFTVRMLEGEFEGKTVDVGTGWDDEERAELWDEWLKTPARTQKMVMRVKHQLAGSKDKPRFPVFDCWLE